MPKAEDINKELELVYQKCLEEIENVNYAEQQSMLEI